jgi:hypothetical protein
MRAGLGAMSAIAGLPHEEIIVSWAGALRLAELSKNVGASIVYLGPGLGHEVPAIATALGGSSILTAGAMADYVTKGAVLGFDVVSGRARILVHLGQARQQHVDLTAQVLKLAVIVE